MLGSKKPERAMKKPKKRRYESFVSSSISSLKMVQKTLADEKSAKQRALGEFRGLPTRLGGLI